MRLHFGIPTSAGVPDPPAVTQIPNKRGFCAFARILPRAPLGPVRVRLSRWRARRKHIFDLEIRLDDVKSRQGHAGFTLIELVIVITILGILAGVVVFALGGTTTTAAQAACKADAKSVETALESYKSQNGTYPAPGSGNPSTLGGAITYYRPLTSTAGGGPWLRSAPSSSRYEVWFNSSGQVYVTAPGYLDRPR